uniref:Si:dkey-219c3.2 n=1 Tax=Sander lucioperca TaxID=283035 RepID=A0A8D0A414_SANLU
ILSISFYFYARKQLGSSAHAYILKYDLHNGPISKMAGASDPLEDMLFNEVDEKAVSDLVGSLESQLGDRKAPAASYSDGKRDAAPTVAGQFSGKVREQVGSVEPQQGHPKAALLTQEPGANVSEPLSGNPLTSSTSSVAAGAVITAGASLQTVGVGASPVISPGTLPTQPGAASFQRTAVLGSSVLAPGSSATEAIRTSSPGLQSLNGGGAGAGAVKLGANTVISTVSAGGSTIISSMASQPNNFPPQSTAASPAAGTPQRLPGPVNGVDPKAALPVPQHGVPSPAALPQQGVPSPAASSSQVHIQLNLPKVYSGLVHTATFTCFLTLTSVPQTGSSTAAVTLKPAVNGVGQPAVALVRPPGTVVASIQQQRPGLVASPNRAAAPQQLAVRPQQQTIQLPPGFSMPPGMVLVRTETGQLVMVPQQVLAQAQAKTQQAQAQAQAQANLSQRPAAPTAGTAIRLTTAATVCYILCTAAKTVITISVPNDHKHNVYTLEITVVSQEMQENVKKCKNFLATLIKLASHNSPSPDTSKNVKALVQDLLDAKIEPEEFTTRLQAELKSSPQPYLIPFLKAVNRGVQPVQTRSPVVFSQTLRPQGEPETFSLTGLSPVPSVLLRDDDDINDVASMAGVNLNEENARILATSSELVGTKIRSCKDEAFLPPGLLHRRIMDTAKKLGVSEVPLDVVNLVSHATQSRLRALLEKVSAVAQHRSDAGKDEEHHEPSSDVRSQLRFFEQLERMEKQRKDEQEREILLKAAKSRARQEDPEQARLKQKAKEMQQQELAQIRQRDANLTALAAIGPRKKRKMGSPGGGAVAGSSPSTDQTAASASSSRQQLRQRITRVNLRDFIFCLEQERCTARSLTLYKALLK